MAPHQDRALAGALATSLASALKIPPLPDFDPEVLELTGNEDLLGEVPWSPMSLCHAYAKMRGFTRGGNPDSHTAGQTILSLVLEGRLPYAAPPPTGAPVVRRHIGADGQLVEADKYRDDDDTGARDDVSEASEHSDDDEDDVEAFNPFRALGIDAEGEAQYGNGDMFDGEGAGRFRMKESDGKGAAASYFGRGGNASQLLGKQGGGGRCSCRISTCGRARRARGPRAGGRRIGDSGRRREKSQQNGAFFCSSS